MPRFSLVQQLISHYASYLHLEDQMLRCSAVGRILPYLILESKVWYIITKTHKYILLIQYL